VSTLPDDEGLTDEEKAMLQEVEGGGKQTAESPAACPSKSFSYFYWLYKLVGYDILLLFGDSGIGKTKFCSQMAFELAKEGKAVVYYDTEGNMSDAAVQRLKDCGVTYVSIPEYRQMLKIGKEEPADVLILDSATLFITGKWARGDMRMHGDMLQVVQGVYYQVKQWCQQKGKIAIITAQPISSMGDRSSIKPMGDKANFMAKVILLVKGEEKSEGGFENRRLITYKSRDMPDQTLVTRFETTADGIKILNLDRLKKMCEPDFKGEF
jgi:hypothetical protein